MFRLDLDYTFALAPLVGGASYLVLEGIAALWEYATL